MLSDETVHAESTTAQQTNTVTEVPSHGTVIYTDTEMKNGTNSEYFAQAEQITDGSN